MNDISNKNIIRIKMNTKLNEDINKYKILYFSAPTGWGKTIAISDWLKETKLFFCLITVLNQDKIIKELKQISLDETRKQIIIIDDFHNITDCTIRNEIIDFISSTSIFCHFVILSRAEVTSEFKPFIITRQLKSYDAKSFKFTYKECEEFLELNKINLTEEILNFAYKNCKGYPISLNSLVSNLKKNGGNFTKSTINQLKKDLFDYYDIALFNKWTDEIQEFLISIVGFDEFTPLLAQMITLKPNVKDLLEKCCCMGSFLIFCPPDTYKIHHFFKEYLLYKQKQLMDEDSLKNIYISAGNYYEMVGNHVVDALKYYHAAGENQKVKSILIKQSTFGACKCNLIELEPYYLSLKEEDILKNPILCSSMSMLYSLNGKIKESEYFFNKLIEMKKIISKKTTDYKIAQEQIAYLSIALPHTGISGMVSKLGSIAKYFAKNGFKMQDMSITGNMPSLMHGGKDFCNWSKSAEALRKRPKYKKLLKKVDQKESF